MGIIENAKELADLIKKGLIRLTTWLFPHHRNLNKWSKMPLIEHKEHGTVSISAAISPSLHIKGIRGS